MRYRWLLLVVLVAIAGCGGDGGTPIQNKGSDTLFNVAQAWAEAYRDVEPSVVVAVSGGGSGTGISALINGTVDIANASRRMKPKEIELARKRGFEPKEHIVGYDALAVYVHPDNPVSHLTLDQLAGIYGEDGPTTQWSQLGLEVPGCSGGKIVRLSRQNNSGTYAYFRSAVLGPGRDFKQGSLDLHGSKDVVDTVERTPCAIGYSGLAYATAHVKVVPVATSDGATPVPPTPDAASNKSYPIARPLFMYTRGEPEGPVKAYLDWILGPEGQRLLKEKNYAPRLPSTDG